MTNGINEKGDGFILGGIEYNFEEVATKILKYYSKKGNESTYQCDSSISRNIMMMKSELAVCSLLKENGCSNIYPYGLQEALHTAEHQNRRGYRGKKNYKPDIVYTNSAGQVNRVEVKSGQSWKYPHQQVLVNTAEYYKEMGIHFIAWVNFPLGAKSEPGEIIFYPLREVMKRPIVNNIWGDLCYDLKD